MTVFDASALLAFLRNEDGAPAVEHRLHSGGRISAANWSEVAQKDAVVQALSEPLATVSP